MFAQRFVNSALLMATLVTATAENGPIQFQSAEQQTALLELYTSEGCSSCPPAETWLSRLVDSPQLWRDFVPVAFHVDYWDYLGWRDPWGSERFSERQRAYADDWRSRSIYTPGFVINGKEWREWATHKGVQQASGKKVGVLSVSSTDTNNWQIRFTRVDHDEKKFEAHAVWLVSNVTSNVKAGENQGKRLKHDFAALAFTEAPMRSQNVS